MMGGWAARKDRAYMVTAASISSRTGEVLTELAEPAARRGKQHIAEKRRRAAVPHPVPACSEQRREEGGAWRGS